MQLRDLAYILQRRFLSIVLCPIVAACMTLLVTSQLTPLYRATAGLRIGVNANRAVDYGSLVYAERLTNTYAKLVVSSPVLTGLRQRLGVETPIEELRARITIDTSANSELIYITFESQDPAMAATGANTLAEILIDVSRAQTTGSGRGYPISLVDPATIPTESSFPRPLLNLALATVGGLLGGLTLAILVENFDTRIYSTAKTEAVTGQPILGRIPTILGGRNIKSFQYNARPEGEALRQLRTGLLDLARASSVQTFLVTSAEPGEGKSTLALLLAISIAQTGRSVVLVDGDMRLPRLHTLLDIPNTSGLSKVLRDEESLDQALQPASTKGLYVLTSGPVPSDSAELLESKGLHSLCAQLRERFEFVLWDTPALLAVADARIALVELKGALLVVERRRATVEGVRSAWSYLHGASSGPFGVIVNRAERERRYAYYRRVRRATQRGADNA